ncbi:MAG: hypothetical protein CBB97_07575 [Candidatus Endolissoclinum sp. TMED37]|nr:MAG: hypothetical protein CBB97_07575 [Candidatus Endolissoclinum sp. TMED37]
MDFRFNKKMKHLSIIIPVFNEEENIEKILDELFKNEKLKSLKFEIIFSDGGSSDETINIIKKILSIKKDIILINPRLRTDLINSVLKGMEIAHGKLVAVMDGDLQHRVSDLVDMIDKLNNNKADLIVGSRKLNDENIALSSARKRLSLLGNNVLRYCFGIKISDILSGFFIIRREKIIKDIFLHKPAGFKVLFHVLSTCKNLKIVEHPINFDERVFGESKLNLRVIYDFVIQVSTRIIPLSLPTQFVSFAFIGTLGAIIHFFVFFSFMEIYNSYIIANLSALMTASGFNFLVNNYLTFASTSLKGKLLIKGGIIYLVISLITALSSTYFTNGYVKVGMVPIIGTCISAIIDSVFKYIIVRKLIWKN